MRALAGERIITVLKTKLDLARIFIRWNFRAFRNFVLIIGLAVCFLFYGEVAHAEAVYSFTKTMGGTASDIGRSHALDASGNVYITGSFCGTNVDFDPDPLDEDLHTSEGQEDIFLTKLNSNGDYQWTRTIGGTLSDSGQGVAVDSKGDVYITGYFQQTVDFDPVTGPDSYTSKGVEDIFLTKLNSDGEYQWTRTIGGTLSDSGQGVAVDSSGDVYITGYFQQTVDFDPVTGPDSYTSKGAGDIFLTKINAGGSYGFTKTMGGTASDIGQSVTLDGIDNVYITGSFRGTADFDPETNPGGEHTSASEDDIFLTKINSNRSYGWTKTMGGTDHDFGRSVAVDSSGNVYITGSFRGTNVDFDPNPVDEDLKTSAGLEDVFLTKINADGSYGFTKTMGGTASDIGQSVTLDGIDNVYITGSFQGTNVDFNPDPGEEDLHTSEGAEDIFLTKINFYGSYDITVTIGGTASDIGRSVKLYDIDNVYITGSFRGTNVDFNPDPVAEDLHTSAGLEDIYLAKFRLVGFVVTPTTVTTTGTGDTATFTVRLLSEPTANVTLPVSSSNLTIGTVDTSGLTFTDINWSEDQTVTVTSLVDSSQTYSIILGVAISAGDADYDGLNPTDVTVTIAESDSGGSGGCFIATAAYGSPLASQIKVLKRFRDHFLLTNGIGKRFVRFYNTYSPPMADFIKKHDNLRVMVRLGLIPLVGITWLALKIGPVSTMALMLFFGIGLFGLIRIVSLKRR
jgi:hypothetical protein